MNKNNLKDYVEPDQALKSWGGNDEWVFHFEPEVKAPAPSVAAIDESKKKVHFADGSTVQEQNESG